MQPPAFWNRSFHPLFHEQAPIHQDKTTRYGHVRAQENPGYGTSLYDRDLAEIYRVLRRPYSRSVAFGYDQPADAGDRPMQRC